MEIYLLEKVILELLTTIGGNQQEIPVEMMKIKTKWPPWEVGEVGLPWAVAALGVDGGQVLLHLVEGKNFFTLISLYKNTKVSLY